MDEDQPDWYEAQLKELFHSFDSTGSGCLSAQEFSSLCLELHLEEDAAALLCSLLRNQDGLVDQVDFEHFKDALVLVLTTIGGLLPNQEACGQLDCPEVSSSFLGGSVCYDRGPSPPLSDSIGGFPKACDAGAAEGVAEAVCNTLPRTHETCVLVSHGVSLQHWDVYTSNTEEYEAEGQLYLGNLDEPDTLRGAPFPSPGRLEDRLRVACADLGLAWEGSASSHELLLVCANLGLEMTEDTLRGLRNDEGMNVQEFMSWVLKHGGQPTPAASTPATPTSYRQLKRRHSIQPFDETGRRIGTTSAMTGTASLHLFSRLDDGTGHSQPECILDVWLKEGIQNSPEVLQALDFNLDAKVNLSELTGALENELVVSRNSIHQAVLASFRAEIQYLLERVDLELCEKEKLRGDLEMAEKLKTQMATEVDEHHSAIELNNNSNIRKLEQDHKHKLAVVRAELTKDMDIIQQQANQQREESAREMQKVKEEVTFLKERLALGVKENEELEAELLDSTEKLVEAENLIFKLQRNINSVLKEKFGDLDPESAEFLLQEERIHLLRNNYEEKCRELQDRIDELQTQLEEYHRHKRSPQHSLELSLFEELDNKIPAITSDQEESQPLNVSLEAEILVENLKMQHLEEMNKARGELESKICGYKRELEKQRALYEEQQDLLSLKCREEVQVLKENLSKVQDRSHELQICLDQAELLRVQVDREHEEKVSTLKKELFETQTCSAELKERLKTLELDQARIMHSFAEEKDELVRIQEEKYVQLEEHYKNNLEQQLKEESLRVLVEKEALERTLTAEWDIEKIRLQETQEKLFQDRLEEEKLLLKHQCKDLEKRLKEAWENERALLEEKHKGAIKVLLEEERIKLLRDQEETERKLLEHWEKERATAAQEERRQLEDSHLKAIQKLDAMHSKEKEHLSGLLDTLQDDIAKERKELENHCFQRVREVEKHFLEDQEAASEHFRADISQLEQHYQSQLRDMSEAHAKEKAEFESQMERSLQMAEQEKSDIFKTLQEEKDSMIQELMTKQCALENNYKTEIKALVAKNQDLQNELKKIVCTAQATKIDFRRQIKKLKDTCEEHLSAKDELLAQSNEKVLQMELLLKHATEDFREEKARVHDCLIELEVKYKEALTMAEELTRQKEQLLEHITHLKGELLEKESEVSELSDLRKFCQEILSSTEEADKIIASLNKKVELQQDKIEQLNRSQQEQNACLENMPRAEACHSIAVQTDLLIPFTKCVKITAVGCGIGSGGSDGDEDVSDPEEGWKIKKEVGNFLNIFREHGLAVKEKDLCIKRTVELQEERAGWQGLTDQYNGPNDGQAGFLRHQCVSELKHSRSETEFLLDDMQQTQESKKMKYNISKIVRKAKEMESKAFKLASLHVNYEDCTCKNARVGAENHYVGQSFLCHDKMGHVQDFQEHAEQMSDNVNVPKKHAEMSAQARPWQNKQETSMVLHNGSSHPASHTVTGEAFQYLNTKLEGTIQAVSDLEVSCEELESQNARLCCALIGLQEKSLKIYSKMQHHRNESIRLAEENFILRQKMPALREGDLKNNQEEVLHKLEQFKKETLTAQKVSENLKRQVQGMEEALQNVSLQSERLKSDLRVAQKEREVLKQEVVSLHKQLQTASEKNRILERILQSSSYQSQPKKMYEGEMTQRVEQEQQENEQRQKDAQNTKGDRLNCQNKVLRLETRIPSLRHQKQGHLALVKRLEQENAGLKRELDLLHTEMAAASQKAHEHSEVQLKLEGLQQENEVLRAQLGHLDSQLVEALQTQLRMQGEQHNQHCSKEDSSLQAEQEMKLLEMEQRMWDVELKLHNVKLLLQEKVSQLKDQLVKNSKADVVIKDLYVENAELLKTLEKTEQQKKAAERKSYLLEEKISSLNNIVHDLNPSSLSVVPYHFTRS